MKRRLRRVGLGLLAAFAVLAVAGVLLVRSAWFRDSVRRRVVAEIEEATGGRVELGAFQFDGGRLTATARGLVLHGTETATEYPLFRAQSVEIQLKIVSIFKCDIDVAALTVHKPEVRLLVAEDGGTNLPRPGRPSAKNTVQQLLDLAIGRFEIEDGIARINLKSLPLEARGENLRARLLYEAAGPRYRGEVSFRRLQAGALPLDLDAKLALEKGRLEFTQVRARSGESEARLTGAIELGVSPRVALDCAARVRLRDLVSLGAPRRGDLRFEGKVSYSREGGYALRGKLRAADLAMETRGLRVAGIGGAADVDATPERIKLRGLTVGALGGRMAGSAELTREGALRVETTLENLALDRLGRLEGLRKSAWNGLVSGAVRAGGELRAGALHGLTVAARLRVDPAAGAAPIEGAVDASYDQRAGRVEFGRSYLRTSATRLRFQGVLGKRLEVDLNATTLDDARLAAAMWSAGPVAPLPLSLQQGEAAFHGAVSGPLDDPRIAGDLRLARFNYEGRFFDRLEAQVDVSRSGAGARGVTLARRDMRLTGEGQIQLRDWKTYASSLLSGRFSLRAPSLDALLAETGAKPPLRGGSLAATGVVDGTRASPKVDARLEILRTAIFDQPVDKLRAHAVYSGNQLEIGDAVMRTGGGEMRFEGAYAHPQDAWRGGRVRFDIRGAGLLLSRIPAAQARAPGLDGRLDGRLSGDLTIDPPVQGQEIAPFRLGALDGTLSLGGLVKNRKPLGRLALTAQTRAKVLSLNLEGELAGSRVTGSGEGRLEGDYQVQGAVQCGRLELARLLKILSPNGSEPPFEGSIEGRLSFTGSTARPETLRAWLELPAVELRPRMEAGGAKLPEELTIRNNGPILVDLNARRAQIRRAQFVAKDTNLSASGSVAFGSRNPWNLRWQGGLNLAVLRSFDPALSAAGVLALDASLRGPLDKPEIYGRLEMKNASFNYANVPNGISNANGVVFLYRDRASIDRLTAETGGGRLQLNGFAVYGATVSYHLQAKAEQVRVRYPEGLSSTLDAALTLTGASDHSVLGGDVVITRIGFNPRTDLGSILAKSAQPIETPGRPGRFLRGLGFDIHVQTAPQVRLETKLTKDVQAEADLRLRGDPMRPVLLGRALINQGEILFFGNKYTIDSGEILFVNQARIQPLVNLDLQTRARGVEVTLNISGPINRLNVSYRSDPPLQVSEIVALLATGRAPASLPGGGRSEVRQSWEQAGANALMSQAIANPITGRLQRFFGVSRLKIDPQIAGSADTNAAARVTIEQQITSDVTFTYITNLSRAQAQALRMEWGFTKNWSGVAQREENGLLGVDFLYRKQFK